MGRAIKFLVLSIIFFIISRKVKSFLTIDMSGIETTGIIKKKFYGDTGNVTYYVNFQDINGTVTGESIPYSWKTKSLNENEVVRIIYRKNKSPRPTVVILDERIKPCADSVLPLSWAFSFLGAIFFIIAIGLVLKIFGN
ncbi:MAG: hypothetical protein ACI33I_07325 [Clostridium sp.]